MTAFIPEKGLQLARYYAYYSNKARGIRRRQDAPAAIPGPASSYDAFQHDDFRRFSSRAWARLIRKYLADPLIYPKCGGRLRILSFIDNPSIIEKILRYLKLWDLPERSPPPRRSTTLEPDADFLAWEAAAGCLPASTDTAYRRLACRNPDSMAMVQAAAGKKGRGEEPPS